MFTPHDSVRASVAEPNTVGPEAMLREACDDLEERIRRGEAARAEEYLARHPALAADAELALDLIYVEYAARQHRDEPKLREELLARFPHWKAQLQRQFQLDELMDEPSTQCESDDGQTGQLPASEQAGAAARRFRTLGLLAKGGIGQVLRAVDTELNREVAVKELQPAHADNSEVRERFLREAEITGQLEHPGIVPVYGLGSDCQGRPFYAMRLVQGQSFQEAMEEFHRRAGSPRPLLGVEFQKLLRRFLHVCETVAFAHSRGIIHRDLKPANILLGPYGETLVVDWGLAQATGASEQFATSGQRAEAAAADSLTTPAAHWSSALTQISGELIGTPAFMCPEQAAGAAHDVGPAGDVYSLGATLYMLLTGHPPFVGADVSETLNRVSAGRFARPREISRAIPRALEAVCLKAMARRPADRYASPRELADDLEHWLADEPVTAAREWLVARLARWGRRRRSYVVAGSLALMLITVVAVTAAFRIDGERRRADRARGEADRQRSEADRQRIVANRRAAGLAFARGFTLVENEENGVGMLWLSRALQYAPADDAALRRAILTNLSAARQHLVRRRVAFHHPANIWKLAFSPDGATCLTVDRDGTARVWDADSGALKAAHPLGSIALFAVAIRGDGTPLVAVVEGHSLAVKSLPAAPGDSTAADVVLAHPDNLLLAAFSPDGSQICTVTGPPSGPQPASIRIWHTADGQQLTQFAGPTAVESVAFQPQGPAVATLSRDGLVRLWNAGDGGRLGNPLQVAGTSVMRMDFTPDGSRLLLGGRDGSLTCWNVGSRRRMFSLPTDRRGEFAGLACASDGQTVVASSADGTARAWHMQDQRTLGDLIHLDRHAGILAFRPLTRQILLAAEPRSAVLWDIPAKTRAAPRLGQGPVQTVAFSPDGKTAATGTRNGIAHLYDAVTGRPLGAAMQHAGTIQHVSFRRDSAVLVTASNDGTARLWDAASGEPSSPALDHRSRAVVAAVFSPDGRVLATGDSAGIVRIWNGETGELVHSFEAASGSANSIAFSPDAARVVVGSASPDNGVRVWDAKSFELLWKSTEATGHRGRVRMVSVSPNGRVIASASNDETVKFWDAESGQPIGEPLPHGGEVFVVAFSPDSQLAVTGGYDATVRLWKVPTGQLVGEPMRHAGLVTAAVFSPDGHTLLTGSADWSARLWDVTTCLPLCPPVRHNGELMSVALDRTGRIALTGRLWHLPAPLPDDQALIDLWVQLATQRKLAAGGNIDWLDPAALAKLASEFHTRTGRSWSEWAD